MTFKESIQSLSILGSSQITAILLGVIFYFGFAYILDLEKSVLTYITSIKLNIC